MKKLSLKMIIFLSAFTLLSLLWGIAYWVTSQKLDSQSAAERWAGESELRFEQYSLYLPADNSLTRNDIYGFRQTLQTKLTEAALETPENGSLYSDAWSATGKLTVYGEHGSGEASVTAVGGNFFLFHPLKLLGGSYIQETNVMKDRVLLDEDLAWLLFGGTDLAGMTVTINGLPFVVAGVVEREDDSASQKAYQGGMGLYMSYETYNELVESPISCYELVLAEPVEGFGQSLLESTFAATGGDIVKNGERFSLLSTLSVLRSYGTRSMRTNTIAYPYWENAARYYEDWCALYLILAMVFALPAVTLAVVALCLLYRKGKEAVVATVPVIAERTLEKARYRLVSRKTVHSGNHLKK